MLETGLPERKLAIGELAAQGPRGIFATPVEQVWLEVGFGGGEHLAWQAAHNPGVGIIGCEVFQTGIVTLLTHLAETPDAADRVRIVTDDARLTLDVLPDQSIARVFVLFPDPWPKVRHHKRRFLQPATLDELARIMTDGAELRLGTDDVPYLRAMLGLACNHPDFQWLARRPEDWRARPPDWPQTRYEAKAIAQGRPPAFLRLVRKARG